MRKISFLIFLLFTVIFYSCSKNEDSITNPGGGTGSSGSFTGAWTVDQVQMLQAPVGGGFSAMMKQALQAYGSVSASTIGYADITFGTNGWQRNTLDHDYYGLQTKGNTIISVMYYNLYLSTDGFITSSNITLPSPSGNIESASLLDENTIFLLQSNLPAATGKLYKSINKGASWTLVNSNPEDSLTGSINFINSTTGFLLSNNRLRKTTNGGVNWFTAGIFYQYYDLKFFDENNAVMIGGGFSNYGKFQRTTNGGATWTENNSLFNENFRYVFFLDINNAWASIYDNSLKTNILRRTYDGGASWATVYQDFPDKYSTSLVFMNQNEGYYATNEFVLKTTNGGTNWTLQGSAHNNDYPPGIINYNGTPVVFYDDHTSRPGASDTTRWVLQGKITNPVFQTIVKSPGWETYATGSYVRDGSTVIFTIANYSGPGPDEKVGSGTFSFETGYLNINLQFPNEERWKLKLRRK